MTPAQIRKTCERIIDSTRLTAGLEPVCGPRRRGRPLSNAHPLPRREKKSWEQYDTATHARDHKTVYAEGCEQCYAREYAYFKRHPEKAKTRLDKSGPRAWVDAGWVEREKREAAKKAEVEERKTFIRRKGNRKN